MQECFIRRFISPFGAFGSPIKESMWRRDESKTDHLPLGSSLGFNVGVLTHKQSNL